MKRSIRFFVFLILFSFLSADGQDTERRDRRWRQQQQGQHRQDLYGDTLYATADDGTPLKWKVFAAAGPGPHPAVLVIHGGGFISTPASPKTVQTARDAAAAGFNAFLVDYRLAAARNALPGQKSTGRYPDQTNDLKQAVRAARKYPGGNGKVGAIGGSAGGAHDVYLAATGTKRDDRLDAAVALSGAYDFTDRDSLGHGNFRRLVMNYAGESDEDLRKASPITHVDASVSPLYLMASDNEAMPPEQLPDLVRKLKEVGATNFKQLLRTNSQQHAFSYWPEVKERSLEFLKENLGGGGTAAKADGPATLQATAASLAMRAIF